MSKRILSFFLVFLLGIATIACGKKEKQNKQLTISVIPKGTSHAFWQSVHAGAVKAGKELGVNVLWVGPEKEDDRQQQITLVDNQVINQVDAIVLAPTDAVALRRPVKSAVRQGVPVVIIDSGLEDSEDIYTSFVATNNVKGGEIAANKLAEMLEGNGNVILLRLLEGHASTGNREKGFLSAIAQYPGITVVSSEQYGGATKATAQNASENLLLRFKDEEGNFTVDGIFCVNESTTYGMLQALRRHRLAGQVKFVGFDAAEALLEGMEKEEINGLVVQNPLKMGYLGVKTAVDHLQGKPVEKRIDTGVVFVVKEDMDKPEMHELLYPDLEKWLQ
ncbi:MAG: substrate-binding domain-containing protein [Deferribacteres bacterium]|nr:substrate-binding domain-containing protein [candidate division KSB1 bacterium]MCB9500589.1 substrate-binding domain-containing protein [Deferribacteres bacterium]